jgi:hypothetical protein
MIMSAFAPAMLRSGALQIEDAAVARRLAPDLD